MGSRNHKAYLPISDVGSEEHIRELHRCHALICGSDSLLECCAETNNCKDTTTSSDNFAGLKLCTRMEEQTSYILTVSTGLRPEERNRFAKHTLWK